MPPVVTSRAIVLAAVAGLAGRAHVAHAQYPIAPPATYTSLVTLPATGAVQIASGPVVLVGAIGQNNLGFSYWLQFFDTTVVPVTTVTSYAWSSPTIANNTVGPALVPAGGIVFRNGLWFDVSNVGSYYNTIAGDTGYWVVVWRRLP